MTSWSFSVNCEWSAWDQPSCPATCGSSVFITKTRRKKLEASDGGLDCEGNSEMQERCNISECKVILKEVIEGIITSFISSNSAYLAEQSSKK